MPVLIIELRLKIFNKNPKKYIPQYGGYCAYAIAVKSDKVSINPKTFQIKGDKLYLFYNAWGTNTLDLWKKENENVLREKADENWKNLRFKK
ncbi:MAG: YHS domain-containing (seleno)protein [Algibacter sp.]|uniref:YHS domain-containing (seleno)protein n=1 Tax=Algibacter sp. TaxID=1872428 RepID=UPI0026089F8E|nr:YHS domain-containing (seleno)protein [Algibacter sp.]MDG1731210.1 YHS domain-containing (seleno)protein [Algibacter sp.]MDG2178007.1 YHS domain-containing (seleno)protein [Algibacter sp.]